MPPLDPQPSPPALRRAARRMARWSGLLALLGCLLLGTMAVWQRGSLSDDYYHRSLAIEAATGQRLPLWRAGWTDRAPTRPLTWMAATAYSALLSAHEFAARGGAALLLGLNALLAGLLVARLLRGRPAQARVAGLVSAWLGVAPVAAHEAVLWASGVGYLLGTALALGSLHACLSALRAPRTHVWRWVLLAAALFGLALLSVEQVALLAALVPFMALACARDQGRLRRLWGATVRSAELLALPTGISLAVYHFLYRGSPAIAGRGGLDLRLGGILARSVEYARRLSWLTVDPRFGGRVAGEAFDLGLRTLRTSPLAAALAVVTVGFLVLAVWAAGRADSGREDEPPGEQARGWKAGPGDGEAHPGDGGARPGWCLAMGIAWAILPVFVPGVFVGGQQLEVRMLYWPLIGLAVTAGLLAGTVARAGGRRGARGGVTDATGALTALPSPAARERGARSSARGEGSHLALASSVAMLGLSGTVARAGGRPGVTDGMGALTPGPSPALRERGARAGASRGASRGVTDGLGARTPGPSPALRERGARSSARGEGSRLALAVSGCLMVASSVAMLGLARTYAARGAVDQREVAAFRQSVPADLLTPGVTLVPVDGSAALLPGYPTLSGLLPGVFESTWATESAIAEATGRRRLAAVTAHHWSTLTIAVQDAATLRVQGRMVPVDGMLLYAFGEKDVRVAEAVAIVAPDGTRRVVALPVGAAAASAGAPTVPVIAVPAGYVPDDAVPAQRALPVGP